MKKHRMEEIMWTFQQTLEEQFSEGEKILRLGTLKDYLYSNVFLRP